MYKYCKTSKKFKNLQAYCPDEYFFAVFIRCRFNKIHIIDPVERAVGCTNDNIMRKSLFISYANSEGADQLSGPSCSKLKTLLVNTSLKFKM